MNSRITPFHESDAIPPNSITILASGDVMLYMGSGIWLNGKGNIFENSIYYSLLIQPGVLFKNYKVIR